MNEEPRMTLRVTEVMACPECGSFCDEECYERLINKLDALEVYVIAQSRAESNEARRGVASKHTQKWRENAAAARERITWIDRSGKYVVDAVEGAGR